MSPVLGAVALDVEPLDTTEPVEPADEAGVPVVEPLDVAAARALTARIRVALAATHELLVAAWEGRVWIALDYPGWSEYVEAELGDLRALRLPVDQRREVVATMRSRGMSVRAISTGLGVGVATVARDVDAAGGQGQPATVVSLDGRRRAARTARALTAVPKHLPEVVPEVEAATDARPKTTRTLEALAAAGADGMTWVELSRAMGWHHGVASATLTRLHQSGRIERSDQRRGACAVYVLVTTPIDPESQSRWPLR